MIGRPSPLWTPEALEKLKLGVENGLSCSQIAEQIPGSTKGGVAGKIFRLGWAKDRPPKPPPKPRRPKRPKVKVNKVNIDAPLFRCVPLLELKPGECRWPDGIGPDHIHVFCGQRAMLNQSYCAFHCRRGTINITRKSSDIVKVLQKEGIPS